MVVVFYRSPNNILAGIAACSYFTDKAKAREYAEGTVNSGKADGWVFILGHTKYVFGVKVTPAVNDCFQHRTPLRGQLIPMTP